MLFDILVDCSHQTVKGVFGDTEDLKGECFHEHTRCSSIVFIDAKEKTWIQCITPIKANEDAK